MADSPYAWHERPLSESTHIRRARPVDFWAVALWTLIAVVGFLAIFAARTLVAMVG